MAGYSSKTECRVIVRCTCTVGGEAAIGSHREVSKVMCMIGCVVRQWIVVSRVAWIGVKATGVGLQRGSRIVQAASLGSMCGMIRMLIWAAGCATGDGVPFT